MMTSASASAAAPSPTESMISIPSSPSYGPPHEIDYAPIPLATYEATWGPYDVRHMVHAISQLRQQVLFDHEFLYKGLRLTDDELRVLDILETCIANPQPYWVLQGRHRPYVYSEHRSFTTEVAEDWLFCVTSDGARPEYMLCYHKSWYNDRDGRPAVRYCGQPHPEGYPAEPWDDVDRANAFCNFVHTDAFAQAHGALNEFESRTVDLVRRHVVWLSYKEAMLKRAAASRPRGTQVRAENRKAGKGKAVAGERRNPFAVVV